MAADENQVREKAERDAAQDDPENWRGYFYFNKKDRRIFPPGRFGTARTVNFANRRSVAVFILILVLVLSILALVFAISVRQA